MTDGGSGELRGLARGGAANLAGAAVTGLSGFALVLVVARLLDARDAGRFFAVTSIFLIALAAVGLGATTGVVKFLPQYLATGRAERARPLLRTALRPVLLTAVLVGAILVPTAGWLTDRPQALQVLAIALPLAACYDVLLAASRGLGRIGPTVLIERLCRAPIQLIAVAVAAWAVTGPWQGSSWGPFREPVTTVALAWVLPYLVALVAMGGVCARLLRRAELTARGVPTGQAGRVGEGRRRSPRHAVGDDPPTSAAPGQARTDILPSAANRVGPQFWSYTWPRGLSRILQVALQRLDIVLVAALLGPAPAAVYTGATRLVGVGLLGVQAVQQVLQPRLARLLATDDLPAARLLYRASTAWTMALSWPVYCAAAAAAGPLLQLFGPEYGGGVATVLWVSAAMLLATACGAADLALLMAGRSTLSLINTAVALAANIVVDLILIPRIGITGAAIGWAVGIALTNLPPLVQVYRLTGLNPMGAGAALVAASALTLFWAGGLAVRAVIGDQALVLVGWLVVASACYLAVLGYGRGLLDLGLTRRTGSSPRRRSRSSPRRSG